MRKQQFVVLVRGLFVLLALGALGLAFSASPGPAEIVTIAAQPTIPLPTATVQAATPQRVTTAAKITTRPNLTTLAATPDSYEQLLLSLGVKVVKPGGPPIVAMETALKAIFARSEDTNTLTISSDKIVVNGQVIRFRATYGLVTVGGSGPDGGWGGSFLNERLSDCTHSGQCQPTGETLDHIENRPMWLFDLEVMVPNGGATCLPVGTCAPPVDNNHQIDLVDAKTLTFFGGIDYYR